MGMKRVVFLFTLAALVVAVVAQSGLPNTTDPIEKSALLAFKQALTDKGNYLKNWLSTSDPCKDFWRGVICNTSIQPADRPMYIHVTELRMFNWGLEGTLVPDLGNFPGLLTLDVMWNNLHGSIPSTLGQLSSLKILTLSGNKFSGIIPDEIGNLTHMNRIQLDENNFTGLVPATFGRLTSLAHLHLNNNSFTGPVPKELGQCPNLLHILLDSNQLTGEMPTEISNATTLVIIQLDNNQITGGVPTSYTAKLLKLTKLSCRNCLLSGRIPDLSNLTHLSVLELDNNSFIGTIPDMDTSNLTTLDLSDNQLDGEIPPFLVGVETLQTLGLRNNKFTGSIPNFAEGMDYTTSSLFLDFQNNSFDYISLGLLTESAHVTSLLVRLSGNPQICSGSEFIDALNDLCLSDDSVPLQSQGNLNDLPRGLPIVVTYRLKSPGFTFFTTVYKNMFNGYIAGGLGIAMGQVHVQAYEWQPGPRLLLIIIIDPPAQTKFNQTEVDRIEHLFANWLPTNSTVFGPYELINFQFLGKAESGLSTAKIAGIVVGGVVALLLALIGLILLYMAKKNKPLTPAQRRRQEMLSMRADQDSLLKVSGVTAFSYKELASATDDFGEAKEVGHGGYGKVYRGVLESGKVVAIKRANLDAIQRNTEFYNEIELLSRCHHRNLVALVGYCNDEEEQMLVYEFMELGTLHDNLHAGGKVQLDFVMRLRVALGSAKGISYLHTEANPPIFHRDIKSNNILLDEKRQAKVADFGLSRLAPEVDLGSAPSSHVSTVVKGTPGYLDPEYFLTRQLTDKSDVYSFGVVLLELITGMQPISMGKNIVREVQTLYNKGDLSNMVDSDMGPYPHEVMESLTKLAMSCVEGDPDARPTMLEVTRILETLLMATLGKDSKGTLSMDISRDYASQLSKLGQSFISKMEKENGDNNFDTGSSQNSQAQLLSSHYITAPGNDFVTPR